MEFLERFKRFWYGESQYLERERERHRKILELKKNQILLTTVVIGISSSGNNIVNSLQKIEPKLRSVSVYRNEPIAKPILAEKEIVVENSLSSENIDELRNAIVNATKVYIITGLGGVIGSALLTPVAEAIHNTGVETKLIVTRPFMFEGPKRRERADEAMKKAVSIGACDSLLIANNDSLIDHTPKDTPMHEAFKVINNNIHDYIVYGLPCNDLFFCEELNYRKTVEF